VSAAGAVQWRHLFEGVAGWALAPLLPLTGREWASLSLHLVANR